LNIAGFLGVRGSSYTTTDGREEPLQLDQRVGIDHRCPLREPDAGRLVRHPGRNHPEGGRARRAHQHLPVGAVLPVDEAQRFAAKRMPAVPDLDGGPDAGRMDRGSP
jgi:hypothetical protein